MSESEKKSSVFVHRRSDHEIFSSIEELMTADAIQLVNALSKHLGERFTAFEEPFIQQKIDGRCFALITENHLKLMAPKSRIGDRLYVLSFKQRMAKAARIVRRGRIVQEGSVRVDPPGLEAKYILTYGTLKLIFQKSETVTAIHKETGTPIQKVETSTYYDLIDLDLIDDIDLESEKQQEEILEVVKVPYKKKTLFWSKIEYKVEKKPTGEVKEVGVGKIYISLKSPLVSKLPGDPKSTYDVSQLMLTTTHFSEAENLHKVLTSLLNELRKVQLTEHV
eukprot:c18048_g1_i2.p1 GENE.c18048_g1_i2~~c18048_g1_i2.p1  ORF type:complete len:279 (+),score=132.24 c18048_g1_i2:52-888(+)